MTKVSFLIDLSAEELVDDVRLLSYVYFFLDEALDVFDDFLLMFGTSILFLITKQTPKIVLNILKNPISIEIAINSMTPGNTASHVDSLNLR